MPDSPPPSAPLSKSRGTPGAAVRSEGFSQALGPLIGMVFGAGWMCGAILSPDFMKVSHAGLVLILLAIGLMITWKRAVKLLRRHEQGARGEEQVARMLEALPDDWKIYHGVQIEDDFIDHVLVGPDRLYMIETVHWEGQVRVTNGKLYHGEKTYPGYDLETLRSRAEAVAEVLGVSEKVLSPMVCVVGGRYAGYPGELNGVWLGEIQDVGPYLLQPHTGSLRAPDRPALVEKLDSFMDQQESS